MSKNKGFTLVELLGVIVVLAVIMLIAGNSTLASINRSRKMAQDEMKNNLKEAGLNYIMGNIYLEKCDVALSNNIDNSDSKGQEELLEQALSNTKCAKKITVETLKGTGLFEDLENDGHCSESDEVIVYHYNNGNNSEYRAYVSDDVCNR